MAGPTKLTPVKRLAAGRLQAPLTIRLSKSGFRPGSTASLCLDAYSAKYGWTPAFGDRFWQSTVEHASDVEPLLLSQ